MDNKQELKNQQDYDPANKEVYEAIFKALEKEPSAALGDDITYRVIQKIKQKESRRYFRMLVLFSVVGVFCVSATIALLYYFLGKETLTSLTDVTGWAAFAGLAVVLVQYFDRKLVRKNKIDWTV